jgi:hypothetical protein
VGGLKRTSQRPEKERASGLRKNERATCEKHGQAAQERRRRAA